MRRGGVYSAKLALSVALFALLSCREIEPTPIGRDEGKALLWGRPSIALQLEGKEEAAVVASLERAARAWNASGLPTLAIVPASSVRRDPEGPRANGVSELVFRDPSKDCLAVRTSRAGFCLRAGLSGLTRTLRGRTAEGRTTLAEADVLLDEKLRSDPSRLFEVALHEFGHVLGLEHSRDPRVSVMVPNPPRGASRPGDADRAALERACDEGSD